MQYVLVSDGEGEEAMELPCEDDGTLALTTLSGQHMGAIGLKYRTNGTMRGIRLIEGRLYPPEGGYWGDIVYQIVYPKPGMAAAYENKRKVEGDDGVDSYNKTKRVDKFRTTDLIVLGLPYKTTEEEVKLYFSQFGELLMVQIKRDPMTGKSKGFGFIRFDNYDGQHKCLGQQHIIDGRQCEVKLPTSKEGGATSRKIFVGRCTEDMTVDDLREFFSRFGEVIDVFIPKPFRAFAFVTFMDPGVAQSICGEDFIIKNSSVHCSTAAPKSSTTGYAAGYPQPGYATYRGGAKAAHQPAYGAYGEGAYLTGAVAAAPNPGFNQAAFNQAVAAATQVALSHGGFAPAANGAVRDGMGQDWRQQGGRGWNE